MVNVVVVVIVVVVAAIVAMTWTISWVKKLQTFACYHLVDLQTLSTSCAAHVDLPPSV